MSKTLTRLLLVFAVFTLGSSIFAQDKPARPNLPDYTKAPFAVVEEGSGSPLGRPDLSGLKAKVYAWQKLNDANEPIDGDFVVVFSDKDGKLVYASWANFKRRDAQDKFVMFGYTRQDNKWVFDNETATALQ